MENYTSTAILCTIVYISDAPTAFTGLAVHGGRLGGGFHIDLADCKDICRTSPSLDDI